MKTWHLEAAAVYAVLIAVNVINDAHPREWLGAVAVALSFHHASIASRLAEAEERRMAGDVECVNHLGYYWTGKEVLWAIYFLLSGTYSALAGCAVFMVHPLWRRWYRRHYPINRHASVQHEQ